jgi:simple sugar transport system permease protein
MGSLDFILGSLESAIRLSAPLLFAALAGLYSERAGIFDIGLEGKMLMAAFAAAAVAPLTGSAWLGLLAAILASVFLALVHGYASITQRGNQIVSGVAINFLAGGLTAFLGQAWFTQGGATPRLPAGARFTDIEWLGGHHLLVYLAFLAVPLTWWLVYHTRFGLRLRAVGENPAAVDTAGISVVWLRYRAVAICGVLCGFAGASLSIAQSAGFVPYMTAGKGFIALAALIFAKWRPWPVLGACFLFGLLDAVSIRLQGAALPFIGKVPVPIMQAVPYMLTIVLLAGFIGRAAPPRAGGIPYVKER